MTRANSGANDSEERFGELVTKLAKAGPQHKPTSRNRELSSSLAELIWNTFGAFYEGPLGDRYAHH